MSSQRFVQFSVFLLVLSLILVGCIQVAEDVVSEEIAPAEADLSLTEKNGDTAAERDFAIKAGDQAPWNWAAEEPESPSVTVIEIITVKEGIAANSDDPAVVASFEEALSNQTEPSRRPAAQEMDPWAEISYEEALMNQSGGASTPKKITLDPWTEVSFEEALMNRSD